MYKIVAKMIFSSYKMFIYKVTVLPVFPHSLEQRLVTVVPKRRYGTWLPQCFRQQLGKRLPVNACNVMVTVNFLPFTRLPNVPTGKNVVLLLNMQI